MREGKHALLLQPPLSLRGERSARDLRECNCTKCKSGGVAGSCNDSVNGAPHRFAQARKSASPINRGRRKRDAFKWLHRFTGALLAFLLTLSPARAVEPDEILQDPALEARARTLSQELRCVVCQNESIDASSAGIARDLRILVRERLLAGDSDEEVLTFITDRYGDYVLLKPRLSTQTLVLWFGPFILLMAGGAGLAVYLRRRRLAGVMAQEAALTPAEEAEIAALRARTGEPT
ncbi:MAG TPA: cytochrome c-type biogenesis protein CcmH [Micropepsaceae bacterium]|nr:cytochrome c-type biogenesis protein CcmH [Micropepsaceae bacterium]